ncbi:MAG TPA: hypothetical protein VK750_08300, partial [Cytophagaceae bacterium]|nr:hypothetical protein [Cytophagaceae bacterium]
SDCIAIGALVVSVGSFIYSYYTNTKKYELKSSYRNTIICWHADIVEILMRLKIETKSGKFSEELKKELLAKLSAGIETGRFYFPNLQNGYAPHKLLANQGFRNAILDFLVFSYRLYQKEDANKYLHHAETLQKYFTSHVFEIANPYEFLKETKKHTNKIFTQDLSFEDFMDKEPELLMTYIKDYKA